MHGSVRDEGVCALVIEKSFVVFGKGVKGKQANTTVIEKEFCEGAWARSLSEAAHSGPLCCLQAPRLPPILIPGPAGY